MRPEQRMCRQPKLPTTLPQRWTGRLITRILLLGTAVTHQKIIMSKYVVNYTFLFNVLKLKNKFYRIPYF